MDTDFRTNFTNFHETGKLIFESRKLHLFFQQRLYTETSSSKELRVPKKSMQIPFAFLSAWILIFQIFSATAAPTNSQHYIVDAWSTEEGLPQNSVITLIQTHDGYLWFGTLNGIVRFDGIRFTVFDESNTPGLNSSRIVKLFEDSQRNLWIGTETAGAAVAKNGQIKNLDLGQGRRGGMLKSICEDSLGAIWLYTADGELARYYGGKVDVWNLPANDFNRCRVIVAENSGRLWVGQDQLLFSMEPNDVKSSASLPEKNATPVRRLDFLLASKSGGIWRLVDGTVQKWVDDQCVKNWNDPWPAGTLITDACEDRDGNLIVGAKGEGVFWFDANGNTTRISKSEGLSDNSILSLHADDEGNLWVGLDGGGLNRVRRQLFNVLDESLGLTVQSVAEAKDGALWFSSNNRGVEVWRNDALQHVDSTWGAMSRFNVRALLIDPQQEIWATTFGAGLFRFMNNTFQPFGIGSINPEISAIHLDRSGKLWLGTQGGLARFDESGWKNFTTKDGLSANIVRAIADDAEGNLWIGTERGGLNCLRAGKFISFQQTNGFPSDNISSLLMDSDGVLWIGTFGSGLVRFQNGKWTHYTTHEGLISNGIDYLLEDSQGCLWLGSNTGLIRVRKNALNDFAQGKINFIPCRGFGKRDGLPASECTLGSQPAACRTRDGTLWFPTIAGLVSVDPTQFRFNINPPPVLIESVLVEGVEQNKSRLNVKLPETIVVPAGKDHLEIQYSSLNLTAPNSARFKYRLEGHEEKWIEVGNRRVASYTKLPPGNYRFVVTACNEDGVWNETGTNIAIVVQPPFWRTWWFLTLVSLATLGIIVAIVHFISTQKLQRELQDLRQHEALEKERARIARDIHDQVGASLTQMSLLGEMVESDKELPEEVEQHAKQISQTARETSHALDEIVWTVNPSNDTLDGLINYICKNAQDYLSVAGLRYRLEIPAELPDKPISPETRHNVFLAAKEAVTNVVKHAEATEVWIRLTIEPSQFILKIEDNGRGFDATKKSNRNGLKNMRKRMEDVGGAFSIAPRAEGGTIISFTVPIGKFKL